MAAKSLVLGEAKLVSGSSPDHIYLNMCLPQGRPLVASAPLGTLPWAAASYSGSYSEPILKDPSEWHLSIVRFNIPTSLIPICFVAPQGGQGNVNLLNYSVSLQAPGGPIRQAFLSWTSEFSATVAPAPTGPVPNPLTSPAAYTAFSTTPATTLQYYSVYSYQHFINLINAAFAAAFTAASADAGWPVAATFPPFMTFDSSTSLITLTAQTAYDSKALAPIGVYMNSELMEFFQGTFFTISNGFQGLPPGPVSPTTGSDYKLLIYDTGNNSVPNIPNPGAVAQAGFAMRQEFPALALWTDFKGISFQTGVTPVNVEYPAPNGTGTVTGGSIPVITDFYPATSIGTDVRSQITYVPAGEYRLSDLISTAPLSKLDFKIYWQDQFDNYFPVFCTHNTCVNAKLMFRKKGYSDPPRIPSGSSSSSSAFGGSLLMGGACEKCLKGGCSSCGGRSMLRR